MYRISLNKRLPRKNAGPVYTPGYKALGNVINTGLLQGGHGVKRIGPRVRGETLV